MWLEWVWYGRCRMEWKKLLLNPAVLKVKVHE